MKQATWFLVLAVLLLAALPLMVSCDDDDDDNNNNTPDDDATPDDNDTNDDDTNDDDTFDDDTVDDDTSDDDTVDDDTVDDDTVDDDTVDDDTVDDDTGDDDTTDDDTGDDDVVDFEFSIKTYSHTAVVPYLPEFAERGFRLYLGAGASSIGSPNLTTVLTEAESLGIPVTLCPAPSSGSFANEETLDVYEEDLTTALDWLDTLDTSVDTISVNMELGPPYDAMFQEAWANRDFALLIDLTYETLDRERFLVSTTRFQDLVSDVQARGYDVQITTFPLLLDDVNDEDTDIQDVCNSPMVDIDWDLYAPCTYSTEYAHYIGLFDTSPYFVYTYAQTIREMYGDAAMVALGLVRTGGNNGYTSPDELAADIAAAKAAGIRRIEIFKFGGMLEYPDYDFDDWADTTLVEPAVPDPDPMIDLVRVATNLVDFIFNFMN